MGLDEVGHVSQNSRMIWLGLNLNLDSASVSDQHGDFPKSGVGESGPR